MTNSRKTGLETVVCFNPVFKYVYLGGGYDNQPDEEEVCGRISLD